LKIKVLVLSKKNNFATVNGKMESILKYYPNYPKGFFFNFFSVIEKFFGYKFLKEIKQLIG
jgi:hypothetical protein